MKVICPYCNKKAKLVTGKTIYFFAKPLHKKFFWFCKPCDSYVGVHPNTKVPLGTLANLELRNLRVQVHTKFDPLWKKGKMSRNKAYNWLSRQLNIEKDKCHIAMFDIETCEKVIKLLK